MHNNKNWTKKVVSPAPTYICDGLGRDFNTNSPYDFIHHQSMPHNWKIGTQNWCFKKAKLLAQDMKPVGLKASSPTVFASSDIRVKKGELPPNIKMSYCKEPTSTTPSNISNPTQTTLTSSPTPTEEVSTPLASTTTPTNLTPTISNIVPTTISTSDAKLYFPISYFIWKRNLQAPPPTPLFPPWALFPKPRGKKVRSSSHLKWDRRLHDGPVYCFGVNDPTVGYSSQRVTLTQGIGVPKIKEDGSWASYSQLLVPKVKPHYTVSNQVFKPCHYHLKNKRRVSRPKSGQNTIQKGHGLSLKDQLNGLGKKVLSEVPCSRKYNTSFNPKANTLSQSSPLPITTTSPNTLSTIHR